MVMTGLARAMGRLGSGGGNIGLNQLGPLVRARDREA
jgi:hypothetical protein